MSDADGRSLHVSIPDADLRRFARERARLFFGGVASEYIKELIRLDRDRNTVPDEIGRRLTDTSGPVREALAQ